MAEINFDCPHCGQNLDAPDDMAGWGIDCPNCKRKIRIPMPKTSLIDPAGEEPVKKDATVRIDVPSEYHQPEAPQRIVKIKRLGH